MFVFGGRVNEQQISKVSDCKLKNIGQLSFKMRYGPGLISFSVTFVLQFNPTDCACANYKDERLYICFANFLTDSSSKKCQYAIDPLGDFENEVDLAYGHDSTKIACSDGKFHLKVDSMKRFRSYSGGWKSTTVECEERTVEHF